MSFEWVSNQYLTQVIQLPNAFSPEECNRIIAINHPMHEAKIIGKDNDTPIEKTIRSSRLKPIIENIENQWIHDKLKFIVGEANKQCFNFDYDRLYSTQVIEYTTGDFYNWHIDIGPLDNCFRKISLVVFLSDPKTFEGGHLQMSEISLPQEQGTAVLFPSYLRHQVQTVTNGVRYSMVSWAIGPCFR